MSEKIANIIIAILSILIFIVMVLFMVLPSFSYYQSAKHISGDITIGEAHFEFVNDLPLFSSVDNFAGGEIAESVSVVNAHDQLGANLNNLVDCYLRFQVLASESVEANVNSNDFTKSGVYYYYNGVFTVGSRLELVSSFYVGTATDEEYQNGLDISVQVEVMQASKNLINEVFTSAPDEWIALLP